MRSACSRRPRTGPRAPPSEAPGRLANPDDIAVLDRGAYVVQRRLGITSCGAAIVVEGEKTDVLQPGVGVSSMAEIEIRRRAFR
jgi:hypothetical protein